jgi:hypothetical protein
VTIAGDLTALAWRRASAAQAVELDLIEHRQWQDDETQGVAGKGQQRRQENTEKARSRSAAQRRRDIPAGDRSEGDLILYRRR